MTFARIRFQAAVLLFLAWIGWLAYLAIVSAHPMVLSRPQLLVSTLDVIAEVKSLDGDQGHIKILEVHWPPADLDRYRDKEIAVINLSECKEHWRGPGQYIVPLLAEPPDQYRVAPVPRSPGFPGPQSPAGQPRIYPLTPETRRQLDSVQKGL